MLTEALRGTNTIVIWLNVCAAGGGGAIGFIAGGVLRTGGFGLARVISDARGGWLRRRHRSRLTDNIMSDRRAAILSCAALKPVAADGSGGASAGRGVAGDSVVSVGGVGTTGEASTTGSTERSSTGAFWTGCGDVWLTGGCVERAGRGAVAGGVSVGSWRGAGAGTTGSGVGAGGGGSRRKSRNSGGVFVPAS